MSTAAVFCMLDTTGTFTVKRGTSIYKIPDKCFGYSTLSESISRILTMVGRPANVPNVDNITDLRNIDLYPTFMLYTAPALEYLEQYIHA